MSAALLRHPSSPAAAISSIQVELSRSEANDLVITYTVHGECGKSDRLRIPTPLAAPSTQITDGLWEHTCFEAFLAQPDGTAYREFNFAPSGQWAIYDFSAYRVREEKPLPTAAPQISLQRDADRFTLRVVLAAELVPAAMQHAGITAVIETTDGAKQYWALAHPGERPDFHLREAFLLTLPAN